MVRRWTTRNIPSLDTKTIIVTGASAGIGLDIAQVLVQKGAQVIMAVRDIEKGEIVAECFRNGNPGAKVHAMKLDLSQLDSVRSFAASFLASFEQLDVLINNAGEMGVGEEETTAEGFGLLMGVNHLGHFALTGLLLERLLATPNARIVTVTSGGHGQAKIDNLDNFHTVEAAKKSRKRPGGALNDSKLANMLFALELQRRLTLMNNGAATTAISLAASPAPTKSDKLHCAIQSQSNLFAVIFLHLLTNILLEPTEMGAMPSLRAATDPDAQAGAYYGAGGFLRLRGYPVVLQPAKWVKDDVLLAQGLWERSVALTGVDYAALQAGGE